MARAAHDFRLELPQVPTCRAFMRELGEYEEVKGVNGAQWNAWLRGHIEEVLKGIGVKENQTILDFGCGPGAYAIPAARLVGGKGKVYALDKDEADLKELEKVQEEGLENLETILSSELDTGLKDESVDMVLLYDVIHLIEKRATLFAEVYRVLKPDGLVSIYPMHVKKDEVLKQMRESNFSLEAERHGGNILNFRK